MKKIGIIGGGYAGTMVAVQMISKSKETFSLTIVCDRKTFNKGIAYAPYSQKQLLNVIVSKMSAFPDKPDHFLDWIIRKPEFAVQDKSVVAGSFVPRYLYGEYLADIWQQTVEIAAAKSIPVTIIDTLVTDLDVDNGSVSLCLQNGRNVEVDHCVIASGNHLPANPKISNKAFFESKSYFQNPWQPESVSNISGTKPVLIIGNGLTMVDTVMGLTENGFSGRILSLSPNGFNILQHQNYGINYLKLTEELTENPSLYELVKLVNKHIKLLRKVGLTAEPAIDSLRPHTQRIWRNLSETEKVVFMSRIRHLWGVARHRIPGQINEIISGLKNSDRLEVLSGKIIDITERGNTIRVEYFDKKEQKIKTLEVSRVINCTGPDSDLRNLNSSYLNKCLSKGILVQDSLRLGISADIGTYAVLKADRVPHSNLYTLGSNLKGELWESIAVPELRNQAEKLAETLLKRLDQ